MSDVTVTPFDPIEVSGTDQDNDTVVVVLEYVPVPGPTGQQGPPGPAGPAGPTGLPGEWTQVTQVEYDALSPPDPNTLYVVIG